MATQAVERQLALVAIVNNAWQRGDNLQRLPQLCPIVAYQTVERIG